MSLICGFQLCSNPLATTVWTHPNGRHINMSHNRYTLDSGPDVLQLNISNASEADKGMWICTVIYNDQPSLSLNLSLEVLGMLIFSPFLFILFFSNYMQFLLVRLVIL